ncbi:uncharacterized protein TNCV_1113931 [Trichonephila clavipes]|nr:uncharacterized protein TNCV_1113931 [Trichonephila clavipes]
MAEYGTPWPLDQIYGSGYTAATISRSHTLYFFPTGQFQGIGSWRRSGFSNRLFCSSTCCLYFGGYRTVVTFALIHSTVRYSLPRYALSTLRIPVFLNICSDEAHFWLNGYVNKQNCRIWSEANPQVYVETPLHPEKLTVWCALWAGGILLQKR